MFPSGPKEKTTQTVWPMLRLCVAELQSITLRPTVNTVLLLLLLIYFMFGAFMNKDSTSDWSMLLHYSVKINKTFENIWLFLSLGLVIISWLSVICQVFLIQKTHFYCTVAPQHASNKHHYKQRQNIYNNNDEILITTRATSAWFGEDKDKTFMKSCLLC